MDCSQPWVLNSCSYSSSFFIGFFSMVSELAQADFVVIFFVAVVSFLLLLVVVGGEDEKGKQCQGIGSSWSVCGIVVGRR